MPVNPLLFLDISGGEFLFILIVAFLVFGPKKLPEIARKMGRTMNQIKSVSGELTREFTDQTKNITSELKAAMESARVEIDTPDLEKVLEQNDGERIKAIRQKNIQNNKPTFAEDVTNDSTSNTTSPDNNNNQQNTSVNPQVNPQKD